MSGRSKRLSATDCVYLKADEIPEACARGVRSSQPEPVLPQITSAGPGEEPSQNKNTDGTGIAALESALQNVLEHPSELSSL